jgi:hypothetical protein
MNMEKERVLVAKIIDMVECAIREAHPKVEKMARNCRGNTLLNDVRYYDLEDSLTNFLKDACLLCSKRKPFNPSKRI